MTSSLVFVGIFFVSFFATLLNGKFEKIEQMMSTACSAQSILLALNALHYSGMWRTGRLSFNRSISNLLGLHKNETVIGYLYIGTNVGPKKQKDSPNNNDFVEIWS